jgi:hypothetical protein
MRIANIALSCLFYFATWIQKNTFEYLWIPLTCLQYLILFQAKSSELSLNVVAQWSTWQARKIWIEGGANGKVLQKSGACPALQLFQPLKRIHILITYDNISYIIIHPIPISFPSEPSPSGTSCRGWWSWAVPLWAAAPASRRCSRPRRWRSPGQRGCRASVVFSGAPSGGLGVLKTSWERSQWEAVTSSTIWFSFSRNILEVLLFSNKWLQMGQI